ncbi:protein ABHD11-like [Uloborus diversus]|uniref:protein ABHD11-like n=1 Tax=Uloborus diversus TaxID=327109 RepID=UPI0024095096|nr:protein ABHD11-like [Uloborus diversus]
MSGRLFIFLCFTALQNAITYPINNSGITPIDLSYECIDKTEECGNKAPVLLLHGLGGSKNNWNGIYETLALRTGRRVCRADLRNHGDSPWNNETSVAAMTEDVIHLLDTIEEQTSVIIGHSLGGKVAMHTALNYPDRVSSLVIEDITPNTLDPEIVMIIENYLYQMKIVMEAIPEGSDETQANKVISPHFKEFLKKFNITETDEAQNRLSPPLTCVGGTCRWRANLDVFLDAIENHFDSFWTPSSGTFINSALFIYGTVSEFKVNEDEANIRALFPNAELIGVEGAGHIIHGFYPQFENEVLNFLNKNN